MLKLVLILTSITIIASTLQAQLVTGAELEELLAASHGKPDREVARQLSTLVLAERLSPAMLAHCEADLPGESAHRQFIALVNTGAFLELSAAELPSIPRPDLATQRRMLAATVNYVTGSVHQLPNLFATRTTTSFERTPDKPWTFSSRAAAKVFYRNGEEVLDRSANQPIASQGLATSGEFGPILGTVMLDAAQSNLAWSHWEPSSTGTLAVFRFSVAAAKSHYEVAYCCEERYSSARAPIRTNVGYQGEIAVDPLTGTVTRLVLHADLKKTDPFSKADIFVEYGPVQIGAKTYICPVKSGAYSVPGWGGIGTWLNVILFDDYHVFRSTISIVPTDK